MFHKSRLLENRATTATAAERQENEAHGASRGDQQANEEAAPEGRKNLNEFQANGSYIELVISSSKNLIEKSRREIIDLVLAEVREFFPAAREAKLIKCTVIKEVKATYSPRPGIDAYRPTQCTPWPRVFLAGDWTATGWPATMEGAVRSGYLAADALMRSREIKTAKFLTPDLAPTGLMRMFKR
jgi:zeta-carotene desaturase